VVKKGRSRIGHMKGVAGAPQIRIAKEGQSSGRACRAYKSTDIPWADYGLT
jgi:hypothetical protein